MFLKLALKNITSKKSSLVISLFIAFSITVLFVSNSIFDSTENGVQQAYVSCFTGDIAIRPVNESPLSLLGDETPITGSFTKIPLIPAYENIKKIIDDTSEISTYNPQVIGNVAVEINDDKLPVIIFGIDPDSYFKQMSALKIVKGDVWQDGEKGIMLSTGIASKLGADYGDELQFIVSEGFSIRIRSARVCGIYEYPVNNSAFSDIVLMNTDTARELLDIQSLYSSDVVELSDDVEGLLSDSDLDNLFEEDFSLEGVAEEAEAAEEAAAAEQEAASDISDNSVETSWNYITCRLSDSKKAEWIIKKLNRIFKQKNIEAEAVNWRSAGGSNTMYVYFLRVILNIGIVIILIAGFIIINNTFYVNILERSREIGTMRAIGTTRLFVSLECMSETMIIAAVSGIAGLICGLIISRLLNVVQIKLSNDFLVQLFGGDTLYTVLKASSVIRCYIVAIILGMISWINPVRAALNTSPVTAMQGVK